jgi:hypothetical protein
MKGRMSRQDESDEAEIASFGVALRIPDESRVKFCLPFNLMSSLPRR